MLVYILAVPLSIQLPACGLESSQGRPKALGPCTRMGDLEEAPGSWLQISSALAIVAIWGVNKRMEYLCMSSL